LINSSEILNKITSLINDDADFNFNEIALELFYFQSEHCEIYKQYLQHLKLNPKQIKNINTIPHLPIEFFKYYDVSSFPILKAEHYFLSSGTSKQTKSKHLLYDAKLYQKNVLNAFNRIYGNVNDYHILALLPSYLEQKNSSLIFMMDYLLSQSKSLDKTSYLNDFQLLKENINEILTKNEKVVLVGVSYALLDFAEQFSFNFNNIQNLTIIETGGMKGRKKEMLRSELHQILMQSFKTKNINSEYGMCELMSQSYSTGNGIFESAKTKKVIIKELTDPFKTLENGKSGRINIIDLANVYTCSFIETADIGKQFENGTFEVLGRMDNSEIRGCSLMI